MFKREKSGMLKKMLSSSYQTRNRNYHSTETLQNNTILKAIEKQEAIALMLLDLSKAFDSISDSRLF